MCETGEFNHLQAEGETAQKQKRVYNFAQLTSILVLLELGILWFNPLLAFAVGILTVASGIRAAHQIKTSANPPKYKKLSMVTAVVFPILFLLLTYWSIDAPRIQDDYTLDDLKQVAPEHEGTYQLLCSLKDHEEQNLCGSAIGLTLVDTELLKRMGQMTSLNSYHETCQALDQNTPDIMRLWQASQPGRNVIEQLAASPEIADLTEPNFFYESEGYLENLRRLTFLYSNYCCLQVKNGKVQEAVQELKTFQSFVQKYNMNCRSTNSKLICMALYHANIEVATFTLNGGDTSSEVIQQIAAIFPALSETDTNLNNVLIYEYLVFRSTLDMFADELHLRKHAMRIHNLKHNSASRLVRNRLNQLMGSNEPPLRVWPLVYPNFPITLCDSGLGVPDYYYLYNPVGAVAASLSFTPMEQFLELNFRRHLYNDLLHILIDYRLGKPTQLKARAYSDSYIVDLDQAMIYSPGMDQEVGTKDDIKLPINVDVYQGLGDH